VIAASPIVVRLSADAMRLEACLAPEALDMPPDDLLKTISDESALLGVTFSVTPGDLQTRSAAYAPGEWITIMRAPDPSPPVDGRIEMLVSIPVASGQRNVQGARSAVKAGTALARRLPALPGRPSRDLLGREAPARRPHEARLPQGNNTQIGADQNLLLATCDGEVRLRAMRIEVVPMHVSEGDVLEGATLSTELQPIFIAGSVREGASIECGGDVYIQGDVYSAQIVSWSDVIIRGDINGSAELHSSVRAAGSVTFQQARFARVTAGANLHVLGQASQSSLEVKGDLFLARTLDEAMQGVKLQVGGAVFPPLDQAMPSPAPDQPRVRQHVRVNCNLRAVLAKFGPTPPRFLPCTIVDLSEGGARCRLSEVEAQSLSGAIVQVKFLLPETNDQLLAIAQVARVGGPGLVNVSNDISGAPPTIVAAPGLVGIAFTQMLDTDRQILAAYCRRLQSAGALLPGTPENRSGRPAYQ